MPTRNPAQRANLLALPSSSTPSKTVQHLAQRSSTSSTSGYDSAGNLLSYTDTVMGTWNFQYDTLNRLIGASRMNVPRANSFKSMRATPGSPAIGLCRWGGESGDLLRNQSGHSYSGTALIGASDAAPAAPAPAPVNVRQQNQSQCIPKPRHSSQRDHQGVLKALRPVVLDKSRRLFHERVCYPEQMTRGAS